MKEILLHGGGWFVSCIMIHYIVLYFIREYMANSIKLVFAAISIMVFILFLFEDRNVEGYNMYNAQYIHFYFLWCKYFLFTLLGAVNGMAKTAKHFSFKDMILLLISIALYYMVMYLGSKEGLFRWIQIFSLVPLLMAAYYIYKFCNSGLIKKVYSHKYIGYINKHHLKVNTGGIYCAGNNIIDNRQPIKWHISLKYNGGIFSYSPCRLYNKHYWQDILTDV
jgi:hypothetical protein